MIKQGTAKNFRLYFFNWKDREGRERKLIVLEKQAGQSVMLLALNMY